MHTHGRSRLRYNGVIMSSRSKLSLPLWTERFAAPLAPTTAAEMAARGWDDVDVVFVTGDAYVDHPSFAMAILRPRAGSGRLSRRHPQPARLATRASRGGSSAGRGCSSAISAGNMDSLINHYTANKKVRNDDAYSPGGRIGLRPDRATLAVLPAGPRSVPRRAGHRRRRRGVAAAAGPLRLLERHGPPLDPARLQGRPASSTAWASRRIVEIARRLAAGETVQRPARHARRGVRARARRNPRELAREPERGAAPCDAADAIVVLPSLRRRSRPTSSPSPKRRGSSTSTRIRSTPQTLVQFHDRQAVVVNPPALADLARRRWTAIYDLPYTRRPHPSYTRADPRVRDDQGLGHDHARLLRRLHVLLDHRASGPDHPVALAGVGPAAKCARWRPTRSSRASSATSAARPRTCTRCAARGPRSRRSASGCRACIRRSASCSAPITARSIELMQRGPRRAGHPQGARRQRHPHGPGPAVAGVHAASWPRITSAATSKSPRSTPTRTCSA